MPLFGPLGSSVYGGALYGVDLDVDDSDSPRFVRLPIGPAVTPAQPASSAATPSVTPAVPVPATALPPPVQSLGTFTTRRTQLFGPLSAVAI